MDTGVIGGAAATLQPERRKPIVEALDELRAVESRARNLAESLETLDNRVHGAAESPPSTNGPVAVPPVSPGLVGALQNIHNALAVTCDRLEKSLSNLHNTF